MPRPRLPENKYLFHVNLRLPRVVIDWYGRDGRNRSEEMRRVLIAHMQDQMGS